MVKYGYYYVKLQGIKLLLLLLTTAFPLAIFLIYAPFKIAYIQYMVLGFTVFLEYVFFQGRNLRIKQEPYVRQILQKELKRVPSGQEIHKRISMYGTFPEVTLILNGIAILSVGIYYGK
jgi:hypothetical protein